MEFFIRHRILNQVFSNLLFLVVGLILEETHDSSSGGHFGINKTFEKIRKRFH